MKLKHSRFLGSRDKINFMQRNPINRLSLGSLILVFLFVFVGSLPVAMAAAGPEVPTDIDTPGDGYIASFHPGDARVVLIAHHNSPVVGCWYRVDPDDNGTNDGPLEPSDPCEGWDYLDQYVLLPSDFRSPTFDPDGATPLAPPASNRGGTGSAPALHWSNDMNTIWVPAFYNKTAQSKNGFVSIDVTDIESPNVGTGVEFNVSGWSPVHNGTSRQATAGSKVYFHVKNDAGNRQALASFDPATQQFEVHTTSIPDVENDGYGYQLRLLGSKVYHSPAVKVTAVVGSGSFANALSYSTLYCWDTATNSTCSGFQTAGSFASDGHHRFGEHRNTNGETDGYCTDHGCWDLNGNTHTDWFNPYATDLVDTPYDTVDFEYGITQDHKLFMFMPAWQQQETDKAQMKCFDFTTEALCADFEPIASGREHNLYTTTEDPHSPGCLWAVSHSGFTRVFDVNGGADALDGCYFEPQITPTTTTTTSSTTTTSVTETTTNTSTTTTTTSLTTTTETTTSTPTTVAQTTSIPPNLALTGQSSRQPLTLAVSGALISLALVASRRWFAADR